MSFSRDEDLHKCLELLDDNELIEFLAELIRVDSTNPPGNEKDVAEVAKKKLDNYGVESKILDLEEPNRANLLAQIGEPSEGPTLVYSGHFDVVPAGDGWKYDPFGAEIVDDCMYGRGTSDMKAGVAAMLMALCILKKADVHLKGTLKFLGTSGEEVNMYGARSYVKQYGAEGIDALVISEASMGDLLIAEKGALWLKFISKGKRAHGGQPEQAINALTNMIQFVEKLQKEFEFDVIESDILTPPTLVLTSMHAGDLTNIIPDKCEATVDIRTIPGNDNKNLLAKIEKILAEVKKENESVDISIEVQQNLLPILTDKDNLLIKKSIESYQKVFNKEPKLSGVVYYTDAVPFREANPKLPLLIYGPGDYTRNHKINEFVEISSVIDAAKFYIALALNYLG